jgi:hypothetical protein
MVDNKLNIFSNKNKNERFYDLYNVKNLDKYSEKTYDNMINYLEDQFTIQLKGYMKKIQTLHEKCMLYRHDIDKYRYNDINYEKVDERIDEIPCYKKFPIKRITLHKTDKLSLNEFTDGVKLMTVFGGTNEIEPMSVLKLYTQILYSTYNRKDKIVEKVRDLADYILDLKDPKKQYDALASAIKEAFKRRRDKGYCTDDPIIDIIPIVKR